MVQCACMSMCGAGVEWVLGGGVCMKAVAYVCVRESTCVTRTQDKSKGASWWSWKAWLLVSKCNKNIKTYFLRIAKSCPGE